MATLVSVLAAIVVVGVAVWLLSNGGTSSASGVQIIAPNEPTAVAPNPHSITAPTPTPAAATPAPQEIAVYVTGEVQRPGVYSVPEGQRLIDVVALAGGPTNDADLDRINLAAYVVDTGHYRIPAVGEAAHDAEAVGPDTGVPGVPQAAPTPVAASCATPVDINTATADCFQTLPGIGSVRALSIIAHREQVGPFASPDGIKDVSGIGDGIYGRIANMITVGGR